MSPAAGPRVRGQGLDHVSISMSACFLGALAPSCRDGGRQGWCGGRSGVVGGIGEAQAPEGNH